MNYLIYGTSYYLVEAELKGILKGKKAETYSLEETDLKTILEDLSYNSLFEEEKFVVLKNLEFLSGSKKENASIFESLEAYLANPNDSTTLIFISKEKLGPKSGLKKIVDKLKVIETPIISKPYELAKLMGEVVRKAGYTMYPRVLEAFCEKCACNYDIALNEFEKLKKIKKGDHNITEKDIVDYVSNYNLADSFGFKDALINKEIEKALGMLDDLETSKMEIVPIVVLLAKEYQALYNIKLLAEARKTNEEISKEMGDLHPYRVKLLRQASTKYTLAKLESHIRFLCNLNLRLISEDNLGYDELRKFLLEL